MSADPNLVIWTTDWHLVSNDSEGAVTGAPTSPTKAQQLVAHLNSLNSAGCIDTGDNKDHYGSVGTTDEHDNYITYVKNALTWLSVNSGFNATHPNLPGNHDELHDYTDTVANNDFSTTYDLKFWGAPYRWTADWAAPKIRFVAAHSYIHHYGNPDSHSVDAGGFAHMDTSEIDWIDGQLSNLPAGWTAIVCTHFPIPTEIGNNIRYTGSSWDYATTPLNNMIATHSAKVVCCFSGHRHRNWQVATLGGIPHITSGGASYGLGNSNGVYVPITYDPSASTLTFDCRVATSPYARFSGFSPYVIQMTPPDAPAATYGGTGSFSFAGSAHMSYGGAAGVFAYGGTGSFSYSSTS